MKFVRPLLAAGMFVSGLILIAANQDRAFQHHEPQAVALLCVGALLNSAALAVVTWPVVVRHRPARSRNAEFARRLEEIF